MNADDKALLESLPGRKFADHLDGTAYHEAGHAIIARNCGYKIEYVIIRSEAIEKDGMESGGTVRYYDFYNDDYLQRLVVMWAGGRAVRMYSAEYGEWLDGIDSDLEKIEKILAEMNDDPRINLGTKESYIRAMDKIEELTDTLLQASWSDVEKLADELMARPDEPVTGAEIDVLLGPAIVVPVEWKVAA